MKRVHLLLMVAVIFGLLPLANRYLSKRGAVPIIVRAVPQVLPASPTPNLEPAKSVQHCIEELDLNSSAALAVVRLAFDKGYAVGLIGIGADLAPAEEWLEIIESQFAASKIYCAIYEANDTTHAGRLYALWGLRRTDRTEFDARATALKNPDAKVHWQSGCFVDRLTVKQIVGFMGP